MEVGRGWNRLLKLRLRIGFVLLLLMFGLSSSSPITSSLSTGHQHPIVVQESISPSADSPTLTWTSRTESAMGPEPLPVGNQSRLIGDHIVLNATFPEELNVTHSEMRVWNGFTYSTTRPLVNATNPGAVFDGIIDPAQFDWLISPAILLLVTSISWLGQSP